MPALLRSLFAGAAACAAVTGFAGCGSNSTPSYAPFYRPSPTPTVPVTATPTSLATATPTPTPTPTPTVTATATAVASNTPSPAATATATATATPGSTIMLSPSSTNFTATGYALTFTASETSYSGNFTASSTDCSGIVTFSPASAAGPTASFSASSVAAGTCHITIADAYGQSTVELVTVTTTSGTINAHRR